jgi:hypothetical protein
MLIGQPVLLDPPSACQDVLNVVQFYPHLFHAQKQPLEGLNVKQNFGDLALLRTGPRNAGVEVENAPVNNGIPEPLQV